MSLITKPVIHDVLGSHARKTPENPDGATFRERCRLKSVFGAKRTLKELDGFLIPVFLQVFWNPFWCFSAVNQGLPSPGDLVYFGSSSKDLVGLFESHLDRFNSFSPSPCFLPMPHA